MPEVRKERTTWRDQALSERHRQWGWDCPAIDLDFVLCEYDNAMPVALVEYKNEHAEPQLPSHKSYRALARLADNSDIPFLAVRYASDFAWFRVVPLNGKAKEMFGAPVIMNEKDYVSFLYRMRGLELPPGLSLHGQAMPVTPPVSRREPNTVLVSEGVVAAARERLRLVVQNRSAIK